MAFKLPKTKNQLMGLASESTLDCIIKEQEMPNGVVAYTDMDEVIYISKNLSGKLRRAAIEHEKVHKKQINSGKLHFTEYGDYTWRDKIGRIKKVKMTEKGTLSRNLPWEKPAYKVSDKHL